jgi:isopenicillin N synthase-like dioxygenase
MILFIGETLSFLTGGYYLATLHQVVSEKIRYSLPFFYRVSNDTILNSKKLNSKTFEDLIKENNPHLFNMEYEFLALVYYVSTQHRFKNLTHKISTYKNIDYYNNDWVQNK